MFFEICPFFQDRKEIVDIERTRWVYQAARKHLTKLAIVASRVQQRITAQKVICSAYLNQWHKGKYICGLTEKSFSECKPKLMLLFRHWKLDVHQPHARRKKNWRNNLQLLMHIQHRNTWCYLVVSVLLIMLPLKRTTLSALQRAQKDHRLKHTFNLYMQTLRYIGISKYLYWNMQIAAMIVELWYVLFLYGFDAQSQLRFTLHKYSSDKPHWVCWWNGKTCKCSGDLAFNSKQSTNAQKDKKTSKKI